MSEQETYTVELWGGPMDGIKLPVQLHTTEIVIHGKNAIADGAVDGKYMPDGFGRPWRWRQSPYP